MERIWSKWVRFGLLAKDYIEIETLVLKSIAYTAIHQLPFCENSNNLGQET